MGNFFRWTKWLFNGKPIISYPGFTCGCCGVWVKEKFTIPNYESLGEYWDTVGICANCRGEINNG